VETEAIQGEEMNDWSSSLIYLQAVTRSKKFDLEKFRRSSSFSHLMVYTTDHKEEDSQLPKIERQNQPKFWPNKRMK
jgi:hypothetical protein